MSITGSSIRNPAAIAVVVAMIALFGLYSLKELPIQLFPNIDRPQVGIWTGWRAASPKEIESEIVEPQEEVLRGIPGLLELNANANQGGAWIGLTFDLDVDMEMTLLEIISRLNRLPPLPRDALPPQVNLGGGGGDANESLIWFFVQLLPGTEGPIENYQQFVEEKVATRLEAVPGVAGVNVNGGPPDQLQITLDPYRAAELGVTLPQVASIAGQANDVSGGFKGVGRRQYTIRFEGRYQPEQMSEIVIDWRDGKPVKLGDIADIEVARGEGGGFVVQNGNPAMGVQVMRENGANVLETLELVKAEVESIREEVILPAGLEIQKSFDPSVFIKRAVNLVSSNLILGVLLAVGCLWWFLRKGRATAIIAIAIPVSLLTTFIVLNLFGRSLNVISLAGLAFAVGMVLDAAIVVSENIVRLRERGGTPDDAAQEGTRQVWGALVASTATTVAIFLPVLFLKDVEGQLFADLALTISIAVCVSLVVAVTILPAASGRFLKAQKLTDDHAPQWSNLSERIMRLTGTKKRRLGWIAGLMGVPIVVTLLAFPDMDYLPPVRRDAVDAFLSMPPGMNPDNVRAEVAEPIAERLAPYMSGEKEPALKNYYIWIWPGGGTIGVRAEDQGQVKELERVVQEEVLVGIPDVRGFASQGQLFGGFGGARGIQMHLQSANTEGLYEAARQGMALVQEKMPGANVQPWPSVDFAEPELRLHPNDRRISEAGWNRSTVGSVVRTLGDGTWLGEHFDGDRRMDIILKADAWETPDELATVPLVTDSGAVMPLGDLVSIERTTGPSQLRRVDGRRTVTLGISPPDGLSLEESMALLKNEVEPAVREALPSDATIVYGGSADSLDKAISSMTGNFALALVVLLLLISGLFRSPKDAVLVVLTIPLATVGGILAIRLMNLFTFQPMDLLTMIGFIILLGLVVNNAILLVHQTRVAEREGMGRHDAVGQALRIRLRPIFMSTCTTIVGMLPLVMLPGEGSVIYRGLATAIVGGMITSLVFTLLLLPSLLRLGGDKQPLPKPIKKDSDERDFPRLENVA